MNKQLVVARSSRFGKDRGFAWHWTGACQIRAAARRVSLLSGHIQLKESCAVKAHSLNYDWSSPSSVRLAHQLKVLLYTHLIRCEIMCTNLLGFLSKVILAMKMAS